MTSSEYEALAAAFHRQTGAMAPGKDVAPGMSQPSRDVRVARWAEWLSSDACAEARERFQDDLRDAHAEWLEEASGLSDDEAREIEEDRS